MDEENGSVSSANSLEVMPAGQIGFPDVAFGVVHNRPVPVAVGEGVRVLRCGGLFFTQQVSPRNLQSICTLFACGPAARTRGTLRTK